MAEPKYQLALITGASSGLGAEFARQLAAAGSNLILVARRKEKLEELAAELRRSYGVAAEVFPADLARPGEAARLADRISDSGKVDLLINNAGFGAGAGFSREELKKSEEMAQVHVITPILLTRAAVPGMVARGRGAVINVASIAAFSPLSGAMYSSTKAFLVMFSENLHNELRRKGVKVQALCPGFTHTEFHERAGIDKSTIPGVLWMPAERVVRVSLRALRRGQVLCIPGFRNKVIAFLMRCPVTACMIRRAARTKSLRRRSGRLD
jgi:hypothetical protein